MRVEKEIVNGRPESVRYYRVKEVGEIIGKSTLTVYNYSRWSDEEEAKGGKRFIPKPKKIGAYNHWNENDMIQMQLFFEWLKDNQGFMKEYSRRMYLTKSELEEKHNG